MSLNACDVFQRTLRLTPGLLHPRRLPLQPHAPRAMPVADRDGRRHAAFAYRLRPVAARGECAAGRQVGEIGRGTRNGREAGALEQRPVGARSIR